MQGIFRSKDAELCAFARQGRVGVVCATGDRFGQPEVEYLHLPFFGDDDIARLDVAVNDAGGVRLLLSDSKLRRIYIVAALNNSVDVTATQDASIHTDQYAGDAFSFLAGIYGGLRRA